MNLFETFTTPNDKEWIAIRNGIESKLRSTQKELEAVSRRYKTSLSEVERGTLKTKMRMLNEAIAILQGDFVKHLDLRTKYETAGKQQLQLNFRFPLNLKK